MKKDILMLGRILNTKEQKLVFGGVDNSMAPVPSGGGAWCHESCPIGNDAHCGANAHCVTTVCKSNGLVYGKCVSGF